MIGSPAFYCSKCGRAKAKDSLQPSTDARDRFRVGTCPCSPPDARGRTPLVSFALTPPEPKARWLHAGGTRWCKECKDVGLECLNPRPAAVSTLCVCSHTIDKS